MHGLAEHDAAAPEARDLHEQQRAWRVGRGRWRHEQVAHLAARHELVHQVFQRVVLGARGDEHHALAGAVHLDAAGAVEPEAAGERVERDRGRVASPPGEVEVGEPDAAPRRLVGRRRAACVVVCACVKVLGTGGESR